MKETPEKALDRALESFPKNCSSCGPPSDHFIKYRCFTACCDCGSCHHYFCCDCWNSGKRVDYARQAVIVRLQEATQ